MRRNDGKPLSDEYAQSPCLGDWDGDGDYDMIVGFIQGPVKLYTNNGDFTFTEQGTIRADGKAIEAHDGGPCIVDWNGDGKLDLLMGDGEGKVFFYPGVKSGARDLGKGQPILDGGSGADAWQPRKRDPKSPVGFSPPLPGVRTKPYAADWNGDGKLDLLVGDYITVEEATKALSAKEKAELASLEKRQFEVVNKMGKAGQKVMAAAYKKIGKKQGDRITASESKKFSDAYREAMNKDKEYQKIQKDYMAIYQRMRELKPTQEGTGFVWVYLRK